MSTACSGHPFWIGGEAGPSGSSASRSSRSSLLCRRLKTRRWSWGRGQGPSESAVPPPGSLKSLVLLVLPQLPLSTLDTQFRLRSLRPDLPRLPFALTLNLSSSTVSLKLLAPVSPCFITPSPCPHSNYSPLDASLLVLLTVFLPVDICSQSFLLLPLPPSPPVQPRPSFCPAPLAWPQSAPVWGTYPAALQDQTLLWAFRIVLCPSQPPIRSVV